MIDAFLEIQRSLSLHIIQLFSACGFHSWSFHLIIPSLPLTFWQCSRKMESAAGTENLANWAEFRIVKGVSLLAQKVKNLPTMQETWVRSLGREDPLKKGMAPHSSILDWRILWTEEPGELQSMGSQRVRHNWSVNTLSWPLTLSSTHL